MDDNIYKEISSLTKPEKLELISVLWDSITQNTNTADLPEGHREILKKRLENFDEELAQAKPWEEIKSKYL